MGLKDIVTRVFVLLAAFIVVTISIGSASAQVEINDRWQNGVTEPWWFDPATVSKADIALAESRWSSIKAENRNATQVDWSGDYFVGGDTHGSYLRWSPRSGFVLVHVDKCQAKVMGVSYGRVEASLSRILFFPEPNKLPIHGTAHAVSTQLNFIPVKWRGMRFLINEKEIGEFGDYVAGLGRFNGTGEFEERFFYFNETYTVLNSNQEEIPIVPPEYERFLKNPIEGQITAVGSGYRRYDRENEWWDDFEIPVRINVGSSQGVTNHMTFRLPGSKGFGDAEETVEITGISPRSSKGIVTRTIRKSPCVKISEDDDCEAPSYDVIPVGRLVTTRPISH